MLGVKSVYDHLIWKTHPVFKGGSWVKLCRSAIGLITVVMWIEWIQFINKSFTKHSPIYGQNRSKSCSAWCSTLYDDDHSQVMEICFNHSLHLKINMTTADHFLSYSYDPVKKIIWTFLVRFYKDWHNPIDFYFYS